MSNFYGGNFRPLQGKVYLSGGGIVQREAIEACGRNGGSKGRKFPRLLDRNFWRSNGNFGFELRFRGDGGSGFGRRRSRNRLILPDRLRNLQRRAENHRASLLRTAGWLVGWRGLPFDEDWLRRSCF
jgi:hypothetical protein